MIIDIEKRIDEH
jgi:hypothetical protein